MPEIQTRKYQFFQLVELLYKLTNSEHDALLNQSPAEEKLRFIGNPSLSFASRDVSDLYITPNGRYELTLPFLNLTGAHSPLPNFYLDEMSWEAIQEEKRLTTFLDIFNHRLITFLHAIWRKYRYYISFKENGEDAFSQRMFSLIGLGRSDIRDSLSVNRSKMLAYTGILASSGRSPQILSALVAHCFELSDVAILSWQPRRVAIPEQQINEIGKKNSSIGMNFIIGTATLDYSGKFILAIHSLKLKQMLTFLPNGEEHHPLVNFVSFILRDQLAWDLELGLAPNEAGTMTLGEGNDHYLGWTTFIGDPPETPKIPITVQE